MHGDLYGKTIIGRKSVVIDAAGIAIAVWMQENSESQEGIRVNRFE